MADDDREEKEHDFLDHAKSFEWDQVTTMLRECPDLINVHPCGRWSVLHQAAFEGNADVCKQLLGLGADARALTRSGQTALQVAKGGAKEALAAAGAPARGPPPAEDDAEEGAAEPAAAAEEDEAAPPPMKKAKKATVYHMNINNAVDKEYEYCSLAEIASAPTSALQGLSNKGCGILKKFGVKSVKDLGRWKFYRMAKGIAGLSAAEVEGGRPEWSELNINKAMDKKHEGKALQDITKLPPSALQGLAGWADAELAHFGVETIGALGEWKFAKWAEWITDLAEFETNDFTS